MSFTALHEAIAKQYAAFGAPRPSAIAGCACCTTREELEALTRAPREALGPEELDVYAFKAITTIGTTAEFRYYWPRLAELAIAGSLLTDTEVVFGKPLYGAHHAWPDGERAALVDLAAAIGLWLASQAMDPADVDMWVCSIGLLTEHLTDPRPLLVPLLGESAAARANLRGLVEWNEASVRAKHALSNAFWENAPESAASVLEWLTSHPRVREPRAG